MPFLPLVPVALGLVGRRHGSNGPQPCRIMDPIGIISPRLSN